MGKNLNAEAQDFRSRVAIVDTGIFSTFPSEYLCSEGHRDFTGEGLQDIKSHGTLVAYILAHYINPKKTCLVIIKYWSESSGFNPLNYIRALHYISENKFKYLNLSLSGKGVLPYEKELLEKIKASGVIISNAAGNDSLDLSKNCIAWPACYKVINFVVASCINNVLEWYSNYNGPVNGCEPGIQEYAGIRNQGTSFSSPVLLGKYIKDHE